MIYENANAGLLRLFMYLKAFKTIDIEYRKWHRHRRPCDSWVSSSLDWKRNDHATPTRHKNRRLGNHCCNLYRQANVSNNNISKNIIGFGYVNRTIWNDSHIFFGICLIMSKYIDFQLWNGYIMHLKSYKMCIKNLDIPTLIDMSFQQLIKKNNTMHIS